MKQAFIALGANLGNPFVQIMRALHILNTLPSTQVCNVSSFYHSKPIGYADQPDFINAVAEIKTNLSAFDLLTALLKIEKISGRIREFKNAPRTLDLDILLYDNLILDDEKLTIPHPKMIERGFVIIPLQEIAPSLIVAGIPIQELCLRFPPLDKFAPQPTLPLSNVV